jgi:hypothetical protein
MEENSIARREVEKFFQEYPGQAVIVQKDDCRISRQLLETRREKEMKKRDGEVFNLLEHNS